MLDGPRARLLKGSSIHRPLSTARLSIATTAVVFGVHT